MKHKVVVITGGSSGIGKALAEHFGIRGSKIVITGRKKEALDRAVMDLKKKRIKVLPIVSDVSKEADNEKMAEQVIEHFGKIDILINNAGISMRALFEEVDLEVVKKVMDINFYGSLYATKYCLPEIIRNKGTVVGISSIAGYRGLPARIGYSASKFALQGFLEVLRTEMMYRGVNVLTACPGFTTSNIRRSALAADGSQQGESPRNEANMMSAEECAEYIYNAVKRRKKILILTNMGKFTVLMNKFFPVLMDKLTYRVMAREANAPMK